MRDTRVPTVATEAKAAKIDISLDLEELSAELSGTKPQVQMLRFHVVYLHDLREKVVE